MLFSWAGVTEGGWEWPGPVVHFSNTHSKKVRIKCSNRRKLKKSKISILFNKTLVLSITFDNCDSRDEKDVLEKINNWDVSKEN